MGTAARALRPVLVLGLGLPACGDDQTAVRDIRIAAGDVGGRRDAGGHGRRTIPVLELVDSPPVLELDPSLLEDSSMVVLLVSSSTAVVDKPISVVPVPPMSLVVADVGSMVVPDALADVDGDDDEGGDVERAPVLSVSVSVSVPTVDALIHTSHPCSLEPPRRMKLVAVSGSAPRVERRSNPRTSTCGPCRPSTA
jgi:hypothetical protein